MWKASNVRSLSPVTEMSGKFVVLVLRHVMNTTGNCLDISHSLESGQPVNIDDMACLMLTLTDILLELGRECVAKCWNAD